MDADPRRLPRGALAELIGSHHRRRCFALADELATVWEWACAPPSDGGAVVRAASAPRWVEKELAPLLGCTLYRAKEMIMWARLAVATAPQLLSAIRAGLVDEDRLRAVANGLKPFLDDEALVRRVVAIVLGGIETHTTGTLTEHLARVLGRLDPHAMRKTRQAAIEDRDLTRHTGSGGVTTLRLGRFDAAAGAAAFDHVDALAHAVHAAGDPFGRSLRQLRADVGLDLLRGVDPTAAGLSRPGQRRGTINLTVSLDTLAGIDDDHAMLAGYGPVTAAVARQTAAQFADTCRFRFQLYGDDGRLLTEGPLARADVLELVRQLRDWAASQDRWYGCGELRRHPVDATAGADGRAHREPTAAQRAFVRARDKHCQFPGCRIPARQCEIDHRVAWIEDGPTVVSNLFCVCKGHHRYKHLAGLSYLEALGGVLWSLPGGRRYLKERQPPPGHHRHEPRFGSVIVELTGYSHNGGPPPHLRQ